MAMLKTGAHAVRPQARRRGARDTSPQGRRLRDILRETGGRYSCRVPMQASMRAQLHRLARVTGNAGYGTLASQEDFEVSLEHLRGRDPDSTFVTLGITLVYTAHEADLLARAGLD